MGKENLIQYRSSLTPEERRERAVVAGKASGIARRKRREMRNILSDFMGADVTEPQLFQLLEDAGLPTTQEAAICFAAVKKAQTGDIEACRFVRDTLGERPAAGLTMMAYSGDNTFDRIDLSLLSNDELMVLAAGVNTE